MKHRLVDEWRYEGKTLLNEIRNGFFKQIEIPILDLNEIDFCVYQVGDDEWDFTDKSLDDF